MWHPTIETLKEKKLVGKKLRMTLVNDKTSELWRSFMPERSKIQNKVSTEMISLRVYDETLRPDPHQEFDKWAAVEVSNMGDVPDGMQSFVLDEGLYAVFDYKGLNTDNRIFIYIFTEWLPKSNYFLDHRPHFEILGEKYKNNDPESEEEIWIPVRPK